MYFPNVMVYAIVGFTIAGVHCIWQFCCPQTCACQAFYSTGHFEKTEAFFFLYVHIKFVITRKPKIQVSPVARLLMVRKKHCL